MKIMKINLGSKCLTGQVEKTLSQENKVISQP